MAGIAISYRREDTAWITGRIFDRLKDHYEKSDGDRQNARAKPIVFMDYDSTPVGADFRKYIKGVLDECDVLLAVIGPRWAGDDGRGKPRILQESDWVRIEIETALANDVPVVPVLIDRTPMPCSDNLPDGMKELVYRQAAIIDTQIDFNSHVERLIREIDRLIGGSQAKANISGIRVPSSDEIRRSTTTTNDATIPTDRIASSARGRVWISIFRRPELPYVMLGLLLCALAGSLWLHFSGRMKHPVDPVYTGYSSQDLGVTVIYPNNIFTLDTTERKNAKLVLRDSDGQPAIRILRTSIPEHKDVKLGRQNEVAELTRMNFTVTYIAPEKEQNWSNWYVLSGISHSTEFYFRRWYTQDSVVSIEFMYAKERAPLFDKIIPTMTHELMMNSVAPNAVP